MRIKLTALALAVLLPVTAAQAESVKPGESPRQQMLEMRKNAPKLNQQQREQMREMRQSHYQEMRQLHKKTWEKLPEKDRDAFVEKRNQLREKNRAQMRELLTPEQQTSFDQRYKAMEQREMQKGQGMQGMRDGKRSDKRATKRGNSDDFYPGYRYCDDFMSQE